LRKLVGNSDIEAGLERLDKLTQEEARMASTELLKMSQSIDGKVMRVDDRVKSVEGKVQDVGSMVQSAEGRVRGDVQDIRHKVQGVDDKLDQASRSLFP
jgi:predicted nuclease with TOPRIM domain